MSDAATFTDNEKHDCVLREIRMRKRVYPRRVEREQMSAEDMRREIALMEAIAKDYREKTELPL